MTESMEDKFRRLKMPRYGMFGPPASYNNCKCEMCGEDATRVIYEEKEKYPSLDEKTFEEMSDLMKAYTENHVMNLCDKHVEEWFNNNGWVKAKKFKGYIPKNKA